MRKTIDIKNEKFGKLYVVENVGINKRGEKIWKCICDCGNEIIVPSYDLRSNHTTSCGCNKGRFAENIIGKVFGELTVISQIENTKNRKACWECQCSCGFIIQVTGDRLRNKHQKSCGKCKCFTKEEFKDDYIIFNFNSGDFYLIDIDDYEKIKKYNWYIDFNGYLQADIEGTNIYMHRHIMNAQKNQVIDHKNRKTNDNRKENLRFCNTSENCCNKVSKNKTGYKGVIARRGGFCASITKNYKSYFLGDFKTAEEAHNAYIEASIKLHGEFRNCNSVKKE